MHHPTDTLTGPYLPGGGGGRGQLTPENISSKGCTMLNTTTRHLFIETSVPPPHRIEKPAKAGTCARDRRALQQLALNEHVKHSYTHIYLPTYTHTHTHVHSTSQHSTDQALGQKNICCYTMYILERQRFTSFYYLLSLL